MFITRAFLSFLGAYVCALATTAILAYPQAWVLGAPDRDVLATIVTLTAFFGAYLLVAAFIAGFLGQAFRSAALLLRGRQHWSGYAFNMMIFLCGAIAVIPVLLAMPFGHEPFDVLGVPAAWVICGGVGMLAIERRASPRSMLPWRILACGWIAASSVGLSLMALRSLWTP